MDEIINLIANVGFPIVVAIYLLIRVENKLNQLTIAILELKEALIILQRGNAPYVGLADNYREVQTYADN